MHFSGNRSIALSLYHVYSHYLPRVGLFTTAAANARRLIIVGITSERSYDAGGTAFHAGIAPRRFSVVQLVRNLCMSCRKKLGGGGVPNPLCDVRVCQGGDSWTVCFLLLCQKLV